MKHKQKGTFMRRAWLCAALTAVFCGLLGWSASAASDETRYVLEQTDGGVVFSQQEGATAFWEAPDLLTGQSYRTGKIVLENRTAYTADFVLSEVTLPYDSPQALTYLDALSLRVCEGDTVCYSGRMTRIMDSTPILTVASVPAGETRTLTVSLSCAYTYTGGVPSYPSLVWRFQPQLKAAEPTVTTAAGLPDDSTAFPWVGVAVGAGVLLAAVAVLVCRRK